MAIVESLRVSDSWFPKLKVNPVTSPTYQENAVLSPPQALPAQTLSVHRGLLSPPLLNLCESAGTARMVVLCPET